MNTRKLKCSVCGKVVSIPMTRPLEAKYCSKQCMTLGMRGHRPFNWKGGRMKHKGYILILAKEHPHKDRDGYMYEHRIVMEKSIGRFLAKREIVHHKNGKRSDNRIENLELVASQSEHMKEHRALTKSRYYAKLHIGEEGKSHWA